VDFSEEMVALAQKLHPNIDFQVGDACALSFGDSEFSAAMMNFGILHLAQPMASPELAAPQGSPAPFAASHLQSLFMPSLASP
jgi:Methyltransferase domain